MQRCRDRQRCHRPRHGVMVACFGDNAALHHRLGQLLDEQRNAVRPIHVPGNADSGASEACALLDTAQDASSLDRAPLPAGSSSLSFVANIVAPFWSSGVCPSGPPTGVQV
jgi:hypothetical protein